MIKTRKPTGLPAWPMLLLAGAEKAGKTYLAAQASGSDMIDRTLWLTCGEDDPDEYAPLGRLEIVQQDGAHRSLLASIREISALPVGKAGKPHMIVLDSISMLWQMITDEAQREASERARKKGRNPDGADISMDLWNRAAKRWREVMNALRAHPGPTILTARLSEVTVLGPDGKPLRDGRKQWKVEGHKTLPFDVTGIVQLRSRTDRTVTGMRSMRWAVGMDDEEALPPDVTVEAMWKRLGLTEATDRAHTYSDGAQSLAADSSARIAMLDKLRDLGVLDRLAGWWQQQHDQPITDADLDALADLVAQAEARAAQPSPESTTAPEATDESR